MVAEAMIELPFYLAIPIAGWWLSDLLVNENGPFGVLEALRYLVGAGQAACFEQSTEGITNPFCCVYCLSVWTTAAMILLYMVAPGAVSGFALIGMAWIVNGVMGRLRRNG